MGLVELRSEVEKLQGSEVKQLVLSMNDYNRAKKQVRKPTLEQKSLEKIKEFFTVDKETQTDLTMEDLSTQLAELEQLKKENQELRAQILQPTTPPFNNK